jgi:hypothetical protein
MAKKPIMSTDQERYMAFEGLIQWTQAAVTQSARVSAARDQQMSREVRLNSMMRRQAILAFHSECHFFVIAAYKVVEYRAWVLSFGLCASIDFGEIDQFSTKDIKDLRDMREHVVEYFKGEGHRPRQWISETADSKGDASSVIGTMIGGRLDWVKFGDAAERLIPRLLAEPIPFPKQ